MDFFAPHYPPPQKCIRPPNKNFLPTALWKEQINKTVAYPSVIKVIIIHNIYNFKQLFKNYFMNIFFFLNYVIKKYLHTLPSSSACFWFSSMSTVSNVSFSFWFAIVESLSILMTILGAFTANTIFTGCTTTK